MLRISTPADENIEEFKRISEYVNMGTLMTTPGIFPMVFKFKGNLEQVSRDQYYKCLGSRVFMTNGWGSKEGMNKRYS